MGIKQQGVKWCLALTACALCFFTPPAFAATENTLVLDYRSGAEKKVVITGPRKLVPLSAERVYTESELREFSSYKLNYLTAVDSAGAQLIYAVNGLSMWELFNKAGLDSVDYRSANNYLHTVNTAGHVTAIGPDVIIPPTNEFGFPSAAGSLQELRYTYPVEDFWEYNEEHRKDIDWLLGLAESSCAVVNLTTVPGEEFDGGSAIKAYFGQLDPMHKNYTLFNADVYRLVLSDSRLGDQEAANDPRAAVFSLFGVDYERANILTGPAGTGEKVRGCFYSASGRVYIEGTSVQSLLPADIDAADYVAFAGAGKESVIVTVAELKQCNYTAVYAAGPAADKLEPVERNIDSRYYFFDLYRDGAPVVENISAIYASGPPPKNPEPEKPEIEKPKPVNPEPVEPNPNPSPGGTSSGKDSRDKQPAAQSTQLPAVPTANYMPAEQWFNPFTDVAEYAYYYEGVRFAVERELFPNLAGSAFQPDAPISRGMAVTMLWRFTASPTGGTHEFMDIFAMEYYYEAVAWAAGGGFVFGYKEGLFGPDDHITREQLLAILYRYATASGLAVNSGADLSRYSDAAAISPYAVEAMAWAMDIGLLEGMAEQTLAPQSEISRAQAAMILYRFAELYFSLKA